MNAFLLSSLNFHLTNLIHSHYRQDAQVSNRPGFDLMLHVQLDKQMSCLFHCVAVMQDKERTFVYYQDKAYTKEPVTSPSIVQSSYYSPSLHGYNSHSIHGSRSMPSMSMSRRTNGSQYNGQGPVSIPDPANHMMHSPAFDASFAFFVLPNGMVFYSFFVRSFPTSYGFVQNQVPQMQIASK